MNLLETLPGWPEAPQMSDLAMIMLTVVGPILAALVITLLVFAPSLARKGRDAEASKELEPRS